MLHVKKFGSGGHINPKRVLSFSYRASIKALNLYRMPVDGDGKGYDVGLSGLGKNEPCCSIPDHLRRFDGADSVVERCSGPVLR